ncbi:AN1-type zinc finger protein [Apiospora arundinis]
MKFSTSIAVLSATALVEAQMNVLPHSAHPKRQVGTLNTVLGQVLESLTTLNQVCNVYAGGPGGDIKSGMDQSLTTVKSATETCKKIAPIGPSEAEGFRPTAEKLTESGEKLVGILDSKVPLLREEPHLWFCENVGVLMKTVESKMPNNGSSTDEAAYKAKFGALADKLKACGAKSGNATATSNNPSGAQATHVAEEVTHSGANAMGVSAGVLVLAAAAAILL